MNLCMNVELGLPYTSLAQQARVITESWTGEQVYCMRCGNNRLEHFANNRPVADFYCPHCHNIFELKSKANHFGQIVSDGAYATMISRITSDRNPDFLLMEYDRHSYKVENFCTIPKFFFTPGVIERRRPLRETARRAGWVGCNIRLQEIPRNGFVYLIRDGVEIAKDIVLRQMQRASQFQVGNLGARGWLLDVLKCVERIPEMEFALDDVYGFEAVLQAKHLENQHVRDKIRQQLQVLRDRGYIEFLGRGKYRKIN